MKIQEFNADVKMVQEIQCVENVYNFIQQKNQQLSWNNQEAAKVMCV